MLKFYLPLLKWPWQTQTHSFLPKFMTKIFLFLEPFREIFISCERGKRVEIYGNVSTIKWKRIHCQIFCIFFLNQSSKYLLSSLSFHFPFFCFFVCCQMDDLTFSLWQSLILISPFSLLIIVILFLSFVSYFHFL